MNLISKTLAETTSKLLFRSAEIATVVDHGPHFRVIDLSGPGLQGARWGLGDKVQVRTEPDGLALRTYTPVGWNSAAGSTRLVAYAHDTGPGSAWVARAEPGQRCQLFGPRGSLKLDDLTGPTIFVGDETSFALLASWRVRRPDQRPIAAAFEVNDPVEAAGVLEALDVGATHLIARREGTAQVAELARSVTDALAAHPQASLCLTGKAQTIARVRQAVKAEGLAGRPTKVKAYWDQNRAGLD